MLNDLECAHEQNRVLAWGVRGVWWEVTKNEQNDQIKILVYTFKLKILLHKPRGRPLRVSPCDNDPLGPRSSSSVSLPSSASHSCSSRPPPPPPSAPPSPAPSPPPAYSGAAMKPPHDAGTIFVSIGLQFCGLPWGASPPSGESTFRIILQWLRMVVGE